MRYDLVIVGAGPAGGAAAIVATRLGLKTLVVDRAEPPREKPCGGGLTPRTWRLLDAMGVDYPWYGECDEFVVRLGGAEWRFRGDPIRVTRRPSFDKALLDASSADFTRDRVVEVGDGRVVGERGVYEASIVVGADGAGSTVARYVAPQSAGVSHRTHAIAVMMIAEGDTGNQCLFDIDFVAKRIGATGYAWVFPLRGESNVGIGWGWAKWSDARNTLAEFAELHGLKPRQVLGHPISMGSVRKPIHRGNVVLVGEAAGLADAMTGEGIYHALVSGAAAAIAAWMALKLRGEPRAAGPIYESLIRWLVEEVERSRRFSRTVDILRRVLPKSAIRALAKRAAGMYLSLYRGDATYGVLPFSVKLARRA